MPKKISNNTVTLFVNGRKYENWLDVSIACTLQSLARTFSVRSTRSKEDLTIGIQPQDEVQIFIDGEPILTGYVTKREVSYSASGISVTISGASKTVDLQDCCMPHGMANSYKNQTHEQNLKAVCKPFGIGVVIGIFLIAKLIEFIFMKAEIHAYYAIIGLILASPIAILLKVDWSGLSVLTIVVGIVTFCLGWFTASKLGGE